MSDSSHSSPDYLEALRAAHNVEAARRSLTRSVIPELTSSPTGFGGVLQALQEITNTDQAGNLLSSLSPVSTGITDWYGSVTYEHDERTDDGVSNAFLEVGILLDIPEKDGEEIDYSKGIITSASRKQRQTHRRDTLVNETASLLYTVNEQDATLTTEKEVSGMDFRYFVRDIILKRGEAQKRFSIAAVQVPTHLLRTPLLSDKLIATEEDRIDQNTEILVMLSIDPSSKTPALLNLVTRRVYENNILSSEIGQQYARRSVIDNKALAKLGINFSVAIVAEELQIKMSAYGWEGCARFYNRFVTSKSPYSDSHVRAADSAETALAMMLAKSHETVGSLTLKVGPK